MKSGNNKTTLLLLVVLGIVLAIAYPIFQGSTPSTTAPDTSASTGQVVDTLNKLQAIDFNFSVLKNTAFAYLKDIASPPLNLPIGRSNPFAPVR